MSEYNFTERINIELTDMDLLGLEDAHSELISYGYKKEELQRMTPDEIISQREQINIYHNYDDDDAQYDSECNKMAVDYHLEKCNTPSLTVDAYSMFIPNRTQKMQHTDDIVSVLQHLSKLPLTDINCKVFIQKVDNLTKWEVYNIDLHTLPFVDFSWVYHADTTDAVFIDCYAETQEYLITIHAEQEAGWMVIQIPKNIHST